MENIKVTVWLSTYNQEPYVAQALDSILMQKTDFPFEIVAADDCSTDRTQEIIMDYQKRFPDKIVTYFTPENIGGCRKLTNCIDMGLFRGEYLSYLEGDDYWLGEDRLQTLVDFLEAHPEYSRIAHRREIIDENEVFRGYDTPERICNRPFTVKELMDGESYSDFGSVFRNYFKEAGDKYHPILLASRNVCDFQDLFITQDFGPVYVTDRVFGAYRSRSVPGHTNFNSVMTTEKINLDKIHITKFVEEFYQGKYDLQPRILTEQRSLFQNAVAQENAEALQTARSVTDEKTTLQLLTWQLYLALRGRKKTKVRFICNQMNRTEKLRMPFSMLKYLFYRFDRKLKKLPYEEDRRGYLRETTGA